MPKRPGPMVLALLLGLAAAGGSGARQDERLLPLVPAQRDRADEPALADAVARLDPAPSGWDTETFAQEAARQLDIIANLIRDRRALDAAALKEVAAAEYAGGALRPAALEQVYKDRALTVRRGAPAAGAASYRAAEGLARALKELFEPLAGAASAKAEFIITGVRAQRGTATADVWLHASGRTPTGAIEQTAALKTSWSRPARGAPPRLTGMEVADYEEVSGLSATGAFFADATEAVLGRNRRYREDIVFGIDHWLERIESWIETDGFGHHGIALGDANGDGLDDLYVCQMGGLPNLLLVQNPDGTATDVSAEAGVDWLERTRSALFLDLDNDGDQDLAVATSVALLFMENDGKGRFTVKAALSAAEGMVTAGAPRPTVRTGGLPDEGMEGGHYQRSGDFGNVSTSDIVSLAAADYDNDGLIDIYACAYHASGADADRFPIPLPYHDANNGGPNLMIRNEGGWHFSNVTKTSGLDVNNRRFSFAGSWEDYDNDGDQDLYVANDFGRANLFRNDGGRFVDVAEQAGVVNMAAGMSASWGDYDNDGLMDLYVSNMFSAAGTRISTQEMFKQGSSPEVLADYRHHAMGNALYRNRGGGRFDDVSMQAAVSMGLWAWSSNFIDFNNDGWDDIVVANGYFTKEKPLDLSSYFWREVVGGSPDTADDPAAAGAYATAWRDLSRMVRRGRTFAGRERNVAFMNTHGGRFANVSAVTGLDHIDDARAVGVSDWDSDGDRDVWIVNRTGPRLRFARNDTPSGNHWLEVRLEGRRSNRDAIGARLELRLAGGPGRRLVRTLRAGEGYLAQSSKWVHFGLGEATAIDTLVVRWPGGTAEEFAGLAADGRYRIVQGSGRPERWEGPARAVALAAADLPPTPPSDKARIFLSAPVPAPSLDYESFDGKTVTPAGSGPALVYLWSALDPVSTAQLGEMSRRAADLKSKGLRVVALSVDGVGRSEPPDPGPARDIVASIAFPFEAGFAYPAMIDKLNLVQFKVIWNPRLFPVPSALLVDGDGLLAALYKGPLSIDQLLADLPAMRTTGEKRLSLAIPFTGLRQSRGGPDFFDYMDGIAQAYLDGGFPDEAAAHYRRVTRIQPGRAQARLGLGTALQALGRPDDAVSEFRRAVELDPNSAAALNELGAALAGQGKTDEAIASFRSALIREKDNVFALCSLGALLAGQGKVDEAIGQYRRAIEIEPGNVLALNNLAVALAGQGKDDEAIVLYVRILAVDPGNVPARLNLGSALARQGKIAEAIRHLEEAVRLKPRQAEIHTTLGYALLRQGSFREAADRLADALRLKPDLGQAQYYRTIALARDGRTDDALRELAALMRLQPGAPAVAEKLAWILATSQDAAVRDGAQALKLAQQACAATGNRQPGPLDALAAAYAEAGRFPEAVESATRAIEAAGAAGDAGLADRMRARLELYEAGKPYRE